MKYIPLDARFLPLVRSGSKRSTIRKGLRPWTIGPASFGSQGEELQVCITEVRFTTAESLTAADAIRDGFQSLAELLQALREFYPSLTLSDEVTIASFRTCQ